MSDSITLAPVSVVGQAIKDDVTIVVGGRKIGGWLDVRITRGIERVPSDFELSYTESPDLRGLAMQIHPGDPCEVRIGSDLVITGYIDRVIPSISPSQHRIIAIGRGRCQDLVDCSANYKGGLIRSAKVDDIATILAFPYNIGIETSGDMGPVIPALNIAHGQTPMEVIENICRFRQLLAYEMPNGNLMLKGGDFTLRAASGFTEGVNVKSASAVWSLDQRFSDYWVYLQSLDTLQDAGDVGNLVGKCSDPGVKRFRLRKIVTETSGAQSGESFAQDRATWEGARRVGRSAEIRLVIDSWRDMDGNLFQPGMLVDIDVPSVYMSSGPQDLNSKFVIGELTYRRGEGGTTLEVVAMSPLAFKPEPVVLARGVSRDILNLPPGIAKP